MAAPRWGDMTVTKCQVLGTLVDTWRSGCQEIGTTKAGEGTPWWHAYRSVRHQRNLFAGFLGGRGAAENQSRKTVQSHVHKRKRKTR